MKIWFKSVSWCKNYFIIFWVRGLLTQPEHLHILILKWACHLSHYQLYSLTLDELQLIFSYMFRTYYYFFNKNAIKFTPFELTHISLCKKIESWICQSITQWSQIEVLTLRNFQLWYIVLKIWYLWKIFILIALHRVNKTPQNNNILFIRQPCASSHST